jgi:hypothetical protein
MEVLINDHNKYQYGHGLVVGKSLFSNNHKIEKVEYFDRCILNFMIQKNQRVKIEKGLKKYNLL